MGDSVRVVFTLPEPDLLPESVAYDSVTDSYFVGSTRKGKILRVHDSRATEFKAPRADGLWMVVGMKVDAERRVLWVCSSEGENLEDAVPNGGRAAGLFRFDLSTGTLVDRWILQAPGEEHFLNDLAIGLDGRAFVTHMFAESAVWVAEPGGSFEPFVALPPETYPNGIAAAPDGNALFVAGTRGVLRIDLGLANVEPVPTPDGLPVRGIDGLYAIPGALIGVRPDAPGVWRYELDPAGTSIVGGRGLLTSHPSFDGPTTGVIVGDELHFIANAQFDKVGEGGLLPPLEGLADPVVLALPLDRREPGLLPASVVSRTGDSGGAAGGGLGGG